MPALAAMPAGAAAAVRSLRDALPAGFQPPPDPLDYRARLAAQHMDVLGADFTTFGRGRRSSNDASSRRGSLSGDADADELLLIVNSADSARSGGAGSAGTGGAMSSPRTTTDGTSGSQQPARTAYGISRRLTGAFVRAAAAEAPPRPPGVAVAPAAPPAALFVPTSTSDVVVVGERLRQRVAGLFSLEPSAHAADGDSLFSPDFVTAPQP